MEGNLWRGIVGSLLLNVDFNITFPFAQKTFSFVPLTSSLDVLNVTASTFSQQFIFSQNGTNGSRANKYVAQEFANALYNIPHTDFTPRNAKWIYNEMQGIGQTICYDDYCDATSIQGEDALCNSSVYTINHLPADAVVTWSASSSNVQFSCNVCLQPTISVSGSGTATITASITSATCGNKTVTKTITVGAPYIAATVEGANPASPNGGYYYWLQLPPNTPPISNIFWRVPNGWTLFSGQGTMQVTVYTGTTGGDVEVSFDDACGVKVENR